MPEELSDATIHRAVAPGSCMIIGDNQIIYVGPLERAPDATGKVMLMNATDFARLNEHLMMVRH